MDILDGNAGAIELLPVLYIAHSSPKYKVWKSGCIFAILSIQAASSGLVYAGRESHPGNDAAFLLNYRRE